MTNEPKAEATPMAVLPPDVSRAAETLFREFEEAEAALKALLDRVGGADGAAQRLAPGVWAIARAPASFNEVELAPPPPAEEAE